MEQTFPLVIATVLPKEKSFKMPKNVRAYSRIRCKEHVPEEYEELLDIVNFDEDDAYIMKIDNARLIPVADRLFFSILNITGITRDRIEGPRGKREVVFARRLFWLGMKRITSQTLEYIGALTKNDHASVHTGIAELQNTPGYGSEEEKEMLIQFLSDHNIKLLKE
jgi:chromosomal replication initiation ATPase DnaA